MSNPMHTVFWFLPLGGADWDLKNWVAEGGGGRASTSCWTSDLQSASTRLIVHNGRKVGMQWKGIVSQRANADVLCHDVMNLSAD